MEDPRYYVVYYSTSLTGGRERHLSRPFDTLRDARWYARSLPASRQAHILKEVSSGA